MLSLLQAMALQRFIKKLEEPGQFKAQAAMAQALFCCGRLMSTVDKNLFVSFLEVAIVRREELALQNAACLPSHDETLRQNLLEVCQKTLVEWQETQPQELVLYATGQMAAAA